MKKITATSVLCILLVFVFVGSISCGGKAGDTVAQEAYDAIKAQLSAAETQLAELKAKTTSPVPVIPTITGSGDQALKDEITALKAQVTALGTQITELNKKNSGLTQEKTSLETRYADLTAKYQDLEKKLAAATTPETITEELVENEIMRLLNQERVKAGQPEFILGINLYPQARQNGRAMEAAGKVVYDQASFYQETFWAAGYTSLNAIARGALLTWKLNQYNFEHGALLPSNIYGAVGAYKSGEIIYITFYAFSYP